MTSEANPSSATNSSFNFNDSNVYTTGNADEQAYIGQYFAPLKLSHISNQKFLLPKITEDIVNKTLRLNLIVIASQPNARADHLLIYIAWSLYEVLQRRGHFKEDPLFLECNTNLDLAKFDLSAELEKIGRPAIIIIPSASPQHLGWSLIDIHKAATSTPHFVICSTIIPSDKWYLNKADVLFWHQLSEGSIYDDAYLVDVLAKQLIINQSFLPKNLQGIVDPDKKFLGSLTLRQLAKLLQSDTNVSAFVQLLCKSENINPSDIQELIISARQSESGVIKKWFLSLPPREQLIALAISFFDGLAEEQVFAALQGLLTSVWKQPSTLGIFDYLEVEKVRVFSPVNDDLTSSPRFESRSSEYRRILLRLAWDKYRVHIRVSLPWLVQLTKNSMKRDAAFQEIYGGNKQREQLRSIVSETLGDVGLLSVNAVQDALLWLVADKFYPVQVVAARTMGEWYKQDQKQVFFAILKEWRETRRAKAFIETALTEQYGTGRHNSVEYIDTAIVLAVSYAAKNDRPNKMPSQIIQTLELYIDNPTERIVYCLNNYTLPMLLPTHLTQMAKLLQKMLLTTELHDSLSKIFIKLYQNDKEQTLSVLRRWREETINKSAPNNERSRNKTLAFVIRMFTTIWNNESPDDPNGTSSLDELYYIVQSENTHLVRISVVESIIATIIRGSNRFLEVEALLVLVVTNMEEQEVINLAGLLPKYYLEERINMRGGDGMFTNESAGVTYESWIETVQPSTISEVVYNTWLTDDYPRKIQVLGLYTNYL